MAEKKLLMDLSTDRFIASIKIDGIKYGLININKLSIIERQKLGKLGKSLQGLSKVRTIKDEAPYDKILLEFLGYIMPEATRGLLAKLSIGEKLDAVNAYMDVSGLLVKKKVTQLKKGPKARKKKRTGAK